MSSDALSPEEIRPLNETGKVGDLPEAKPAEPSGTPGDMSVDAADPSLTDEDPDL